MNSHELAKLLLSSPDRPVIDIANAAQVEERKIIAQRALKSLTSQGYDVMGQGKHEMYYADGYYGLKVGSYLHRCPQDTTEITVLLTCMRHDKEESPKIREFWNNAQHIESYE